MSRRSSPHPRRRLRYCLFFMVFLLSVHVGVELVSFASHVGGGWLMSCQRGTSASMVASTHGITLLNTRKSSSSGDGPPVLFAAAATFRPNVQRSRIYTDKKNFSYDVDLRPAMIPWRVLRTTLREAGCFTTRALPRLTDSSGPLAGEGAKNKEEAMLTNRTDPTVSPLTLPPVCRKPIVLMSGRSRDCVSCNYFAEEVLSKYTAEWEFIRAHVTLVDAGDPMTEQLVRHPYPLWYDEAAMAREVVLTPRFNITTSNVEKDTQHEEGLTNDTPASQVAEAEADYALFTADLRRKAALLVTAPTAQASHQWSRLVKHTFAYPREYVLRIIFVYPHNGSIMRDVVNEGIFEGSSPDFLHFYTSARHFFNAVRKSVRVMEWLERFGDY